MPKKAIKHQNELVIVALGPEEKIVEETNIPYDEFYKDSRPLYRWLSLSPKARW